MRPRIKAFLVCSVMGMGIPKRACKCEKPSVMGTHGVDKHNSHRSPTVRSWVPHDDAFGNSQNFVVLPIRRRVEKVVCRLLERREHQHAVLHLRHTEPRDTENLPL